MMYTTHRENYWHLLLVLPTAGEKQVAGEGRGSGWCKDFRATGISGSTCRTTAFALF